MMQKLLALLIFCFGFAPEGFDLDRAFKDVPQIDYPTENNNFFSNKKPLFIVVLGIIVVFTGLFLFYRKW